MNVLFLRAIIPVGISSIYQNRRFYGRRALIRPSAIQTPISFVCNSDYTPRFAKQVGIEGSSHLFCQIIDLQNRWVYVKQKPHLFCKYIDLQNRWGI